MTTPSKTAKLTTPLTTPFHEQYRTTTNKDQHALTVIIFRLNVNQAGGLYLFGRCYDYRNTR
ncbi:hypothetical protein GZ804_000257 [Escherichia coli]|nr:hypothetical protein [Escherichia coli]RIG12604.1 hypothetical protein CUA53_05390 [Shigella sonnei]EFE2087621.1 hypothetical protein [Escherichia coli]EFI5832339.1 hypothetical protein [Escherichia coli]EGD5163858.1 hypothetical protein [Escherichia coli]